MKERPILFSGEMVRAILDSQPRITPELAQDLADEGQRLRDEYRKRLRAMWRREVQP